MLHLDCLSDSSRRLVFLVDCQVKEDEITCGLVTVKGGLSGLMFVQGEGHKFRIRIPEAARKAQTWVNICDRRKRIAVKRVN